MYNRVVLYPYNMDSHSARELQTALIEQGIPCIRVYEEGNYKPRETDLIINWGNPRWPEWAYYDGMSGEAEPILNYPKWVKVASNKLLTFQALAGEVSIPLFTTSQGAAQAWVDSGNHLIVARHILNGHGGAGIEILEEGDDDIPLAPLYVKYIRKIAEYRVHVFKDSVIDVQRKRKSIEAVRNETIDNRIRNHNNGWVFTRENCTPDRNLLDECIRAVSVLGLDFGAVDVIVSTRNIPYILEINTAPGLEGQTVRSYTDAIINCLRGEEDA